MQPLQTLGELGRVREEFEDGERLHLGSECVDERNE
jgi:hypothetical protein